MADIPPQTPPGQTPPKQTPPHPPEMASEVGGMHSTGMHSCLIITSLGRHPWVDIPLGRHLRDGN